jgi:hypothetical protein
MSDHSETGRLARRAELAAYLRAQRARLRPADVGVGLVVSGLFPVAGRIVRGGLAALR